MLAGAIRRSAPRASALNIDWSKIASNCVADESRSFVLGLKQEVAQVDSMHEKYSAQPEAIDWASYKAFFDNHPEIAKLQSQYESTKAVEMPVLKAAAAPVSATVAPVEAKDVDWEGGWMSYRDLFGGKASDVAAKQAANTEAKVAVLAEREVYLQANRTTDQTTVADLFKKYPTIEKEVNDEVANHEWCTNIK